MRAALLCVLTLAWASAAQASADTAEIRRGFVAAGHRTSDAPALRGEPAASSGFALGAALGAWVNAAETLAYDLKTPSGDGDDTETIHLDCYDERTMFQHLEARRAEAELTLAQVLAAAGADAAVLDGWTRRLASPVSECR